MKKVLLAGVAALAIAGSTVVYAQHRPWSHDHERMSPEDRAAFTDARIAAVKAGLKLTPDQDKFLYVNPDEPWQSLIENHQDADYARYPLFAQARPQKVILHAGETLFLPCGWWHTARSLNMTISVAFDQLGPDNWADFRSDVKATRVRRGKPLLGAALDAYLALLSPVFAIGEIFGVNGDKDWGNR